MKRSIFIFVLVIGTFYKLLEVEGTQVPCEKIATAKFKIVGELKTCWMQVKTSIENPGVTISSKDKSVTGILFALNKKIKYLPIKIVDSFPNLLGYSAHTLSLQKVSKSYFIGLKKLKLLYLHRNQIEMIPSDTFEDLTAMQYLFLWDNKLKLIVDDTFKNMKKLSIVQLQKNSCINQDFYKKQIATMANIVKQKCGLSKTNMHLYLEYELSLTKKQNESIMEVVNNSNINDTAPVDVGTNSNKSVKPTNINDTAPGDVGTNSRSLENQKNPNGTL